MSKLVQPGAFCPNPECAAYGKSQTTTQRNVIKFGRARNGQQRYQCRTCRCTFTATKGTLFYRRQTPASEIIRALAQLAEGNRISSVSRTTGHKAVYGQVPEYSGQGRPPTQKQPQPGWQYLQRVKHRDEHGHLVNTELRIIFGQADEVVALFGKSTAYIELT